MIAQSDPGILEQLLEDEPADHIALSEEDRLELGFRLDEKMEAAREHIRKGKAIKGFSKLLDHEFWLREILRDIDSDNPTVRSRALGMLGQYMGILSDHKSRHRKAKVVFDES